MSSPRLIAPADRTPCVTRDAAPLPPATVPNPAWVAVCGPCGLAQVAVPLDAMFVYPPAKMLADSPGAMFGRLMTGSYASGRPRTSAPDGTIWPTTAFSWPGELVNVPHGYPATSICVPGFVDRKISPVSSRPKSRCASDVLREIHTVP